MHIVSLEVLNIGHAKFNQISITIQYKRYEIEHVQTKMLLRLDSNIIGLSPIAVTNIALHSATNLLTNNTYSEVAEAGS